MHDSSNVNLGGQENNPVSFKVTFMFPADAGMNRLLGAEGVAVSLHNPAAAVAPAVLAGATSLGARQVAKFLTKPIANMVTK